MLPILSSPQLKALDRHTIDHEPVPSIQLMERACKAFVHAFIEKFDGSLRIGIVCGTRNNGGDGLAIARLLQEWSYSVKVWIVKGDVPPSPDFKENLQRLQATKRAEIYEISLPSDQGLFKGCDVLIDAIFGYGLSRPTDGIYAQAIRCINASGAVVIAVDMPSGLLADGPSQGEIVKARYTFTFQLPKLAFLFAENADYVGEWKLLDIGLSKEFIRNTSTNHFYLTLKDSKKRIHPRKKFDHKGKFGHALLIAGSRGKMGAAVLAAQAALRAGLGLLTAHVPSTGCNIMQTAVPEAMASLDASEDFFSSSLSTENFSAVGIGPGLGTHEKSAGAMEELLKGLNKPVVMDADALNLLSAHPHLQQLVPEGSILTPHMKEFERMAGPSSNSFERLSKAKALASQLKSVIVLKGAHSAIIAPEGNVYFNCTGNPGMAKGGSGDVLTGLLTGLLAQGYSGIDAAIVGVFLHGMAGDMAVHETGLNSLIASDIIAHLGSAFRKIE